MAGQLVSEKDNPAGIPVWSSKKPVVPTITIDWRPADWPSIRQNLLSQIKTVWSPSTGYSPDTKSQLVELSASAIIKGLLDAGFVCGKE